MPSPHSGPSRPRRVHGAPVSTLLPVCLILLMLGCTTVRGGEVPVPPGSPADPAPLTAADAVRTYYGGQIEACAGAYQELLQRHPDDVASRLNLVRVLREAGRLQEALEQLELLLPLTPAEPMREQRRVVVAAAETALFAGQPQRALGYLALLQPAADSLYLSALALIDLGRGEEAAEALEQAVQLDGFQPQAWYRLGLVRLEQGALDQAETALRRALSQEPNLTASFEPLARIYLAQGELARAYDLLGRAAASLPGSEPIRLLLQELSHEHPELAEEASRKQMVRREAAVPRRAAARPEDAASLPTIRVGLSEKVRELHLKTGGAFLLAAERVVDSAIDPAADAATDPAAQEARPEERQEARGESGSVLIARLAGDEVEVADAQGTVLLRSAAPVRLSYEDPADTSILFDVQYGHGTYWAGSEDRMYRGAVELLPRAEGLTVVNVLSIEEYLYSVLPSEMPSRWPAAALQAQAVAARSYTLANMGRYAARGFDLLGSVSSAAYRGLGAETAAARAAVDATRGLVLLEGQRPLAAFYSANCGGHTETTDTTWGFVSSLPAAADPLLGPWPSPLPPEELARWLADRPMSFSSFPDYSARSAYRWQLWVPREEIERRLELGDALGTIVAVVPGARGISGRVREVRIVGTAGEHTVRGDALRWRLGGLRSNLFVVEPKLGPDGRPQHFVFTGGGWGHGVGLCQSGAAGMAAAGFSARQILRHYYGGAAVERLY